MEENKLYQEKERARLEDCDQACNENEHSERGFLYGDDIYEEEYGNAGSVIVYTIIGIGLVAVAILASLLL